VKESKKKSKKRRTRRSRCGERLLAANSLLLLLYSPISK
jgi:hypothetical protein